MRKKRKINLAGWIIICLFAGILVGFAFLKLAPESTFTTDYLKPLGTIYINLLKFMVVPVVVFSIMDGVISLNDLKRVGSLGIKTIVYYILTTAFAVVIGLVVVNCFKGFFPALDQSVTSSLEYNAAEAPKVMDVIIAIFPDNVFKPMVEANMLPVICIAIFFGAGVLAAGAKGQKIAELVNCMNEVTMKVLMMIIKLTPIGVFCLMADVVAVNGAKIVGSLALVVCVAYIGYILHLGIVYSCSVKLLAGMRPASFFKGMAPAMITAFTTTSSAATLPLTIECCNKLGADKQVSSFVLPLGATINMDGTAIYQGVCAIFIAACYGIQLTFPQMLTVVLTATLASIGTAGVPGAGMVMLAMVLSAVGLPVDGIALVAGVDRIFDMGRTVVNITGDASCAIIVSNSEKKRTVTAQSKK